MSEDVVDLPAVWVGLDSIERVLRERPEVRERTEAMLAGRLEGQTEVEIMAKEKDEQGGAQIGVRLSQDMLARIDALVPYLRGMPAYAVLGRQITRSLAARVVIAAGLDAVEAEAAKAGMLPRPTPVKPVQPVSSSTAAAQPVGQPSASPTKEPAPQAQPKAIPAAKSKRKSKAGPLEPPLMQIAPSAPGTPQYKP